MKQIIKNTEANTSKVSQLLSIENLNQPKEINVIEEISITVDDRVRMLQEIRSEIIKVRSKVEALKLAETNESTFQNNEQMRASRWEYHHAAEDATSAARYVYDNLTNVFEEASAFLVKHSKN
jgi:hypothetical protein